MNADAHCFKCGCPLYYRRPSIDRPFRGRAWCTYYWRETLHGERHVDDVCAECMGIGDALRSMFRGLRAGLGISRRRPKFRLLTHHTKPLL